MDSVKLKRVKLKLFEEADVATLETSVATWIGTDAGERDCVTMQFYVSGTSYVAAIWYVD